MRVGNGHVRVGGDPNGPGAPRGPDAPGGPGGPGGPHGPGDDGDASLPPWLRPGPAVLLALGLLMVATCGWLTATWRVGEGTVVPCGSFTPNPAVWHLPVNVDAGAGRADPRAVSWPAALRETRGTLRCTSLVGRSASDLEVLLGAPTDTSETARGDVVGLRGDEQAWSFTRSVGSTRETTAVVVRLSSPGTGDAVAVREYRRTR